MPTYTYIPLTLFTRRGSRDTFYGNDFAIRNTAEYRINCHMHTYHSRFIPEEVPETSQILFQDAQVLPKLFAMSNTADVTGGEPIAV
jgi:hypothetical protein